MNHLLIGLGGTGGKVIRALRRQLFNEFRDEAAPGVALSYLYVDSSAEMMRQDDPSWKVLGTSVQIPVASQLRIVGEDLKARLDNVQTYPGIKPWIGDRQEWSDILGSIVGAALGGQKRRLGRFLFACKMDDFGKSLESQVREVQGNGQTDITFHVVAGLAGGTGSGSMIDVVTQLRARYGDPQRHRIVLYLLTPEQFPLPNWDTGNYHANGFAALTELNALSTGAYKPIDLRDGNRLDLRDAFNGAYVFGNENEKGHQANIETELPGIVADFLFQKIVVADQVGWRSLERMENAENGDGTPELMPGGKIGERSKRFLTFGIKRIAIPEEEIKEYLSLNFARQSINQLRYNNWQDGLGFVDGVRNFDAASFVQDPEVLGRWLLTDNHLTLSIPILAADDPRKRWKTLTAEWEAVIASYKTDVREMPAPGWLDELSSLCDQRYDQSFRNNGVPAFYRAKTQAKADMAREIRGRIEAELFDDWRNGTRSASEVSRVLGALAAQIAERLAAADDRAQKERENAEAASADMVAVRKSWADLGGLGKLFGRRNNLFDEFSINLQEYHVRRTRVEAWIFAKALLGEVTSQIADLMTSVDEIVATMQAALKRVSDGIDERLKTGGVSDLSGHLIRFYEPAIVEQTTRTLSLDEQEQVKQTAEIRRVLIARLGPNPSFAAFRDRLGLGDLTDTIEKTAEKNAVVAHNTLITETRQRVLGVSIIDKLKERFGGDIQALRGYVADLVREAGCYLTVNPLEKNRAGPGIPQGVQTMIEKWIIVLPNAPEQATFVEQLKKAFRDAQPGDLEFLTAGRRNEITMISIKNLFPLRYLGILPFLQGKYQARIAANPRRAGLELHTEGQLSDYPSLFVQSGDALRRSALALIIVGQALGLVRTLNDKLTFFGHDEDGFEAPPMTLGASLADAAETVDPKLQAQIETDVTTALGKADKAAIEAAVRAAPDQIKALVGGDTGDPRYRAVVDAAKAALALVRR